MFDNAFSFSHTGKAHIYRQTAFMYKYCLILIFVFASVAHAGRYILPPQDIDLVGGLQTTTSNDGDTLLDIARRFDMGQEEILLANPDVDRWLPAVGTLVNLPSRFILPKAVRSGIVLNLPEMRIYYYKSDFLDKTIPSAVITHPISVGRMDWDTPLGLSRIIQKKKNPTWTPPESIRLEHEAEGDPLPRVVPAGPDNPLGLYAMRLDIPGYLIHSTNKPFGVGMRVTHGCVRMYPEDIEVFFEQVPLYTKVTLVNQPVKLGWHGEHLYIEIHPPMEEDSVSDDELLNQAVELVKKKLIDSPSVAIKWSLLRQAVKLRNGIPQIISNDEI